MGLLYNAHKTVYKSIVSFKHYALVSKTKKKTLNASLKMWVTVVIVEHPTLWVTYYRETIYSPIIIQRRKTTRFHTPVGPYSRAVTSIAFLRHSLKFWSLKWHLGMPTPVTKIICHKSIIFWLNFQL